MAGTSPIEDVDPQEGQPSAGPMELRELESLADIDVAFVKHSSGSSSDFHTD